MQNKLWFIPFLLAGSVAPLLTYASEKPFDVRVETRINYRNSEEHRFPTGLSALAGNGFDMRTISPEDHLEVSNITLFGKWQMSENWMGFAKLDMIDRYERNPTSGDKRGDLDNFYIRYGTRLTNEALPESTSVYGQFGKFGKFERQDDRHLESYGLVSTAFNRLEDSGFEFGVDLPSGMYGKLSYTTGNPFYYRDPNALAGDSGVKADNVNKGIHSGVPILYDAEIETLDLAHNPETGAGLGYRWLSGSGDKRLNILAYHYQRDMANSVELTGTFYGADLDVLQVTGAEVAGLTTATLPFKGKDKTETGLNLWWYQNQLAIFAQYTSQNAAELKRKGKEIEISYAILGIPHIISITPVFRYSTLTPDFVAGGQYPIPSTAWEWSKYDTGFNVDFTKAVRLTMEYAQNDFMRKNEREHNNEFLTTLRWRMDF